MEIIQKHKNHIMYHPDNEYIDDTILPNTVPKSQIKRKRVKGPSEEEIRQEHQQRMEIKA